MRRLSFLLAALCLTLGTALAQDSGKLVKAGSKALAKYVADASNTAALQEARKAANDAVQADADNASAYLLKGNVFAAEIKALASEIQAASAQGQAAELTGGTNTADLSGFKPKDEQAQTAIKSFAKAYELAPKSSAKKKASDAMLQLGTHLSTIGNAMLSSNQYAEAYGPLQQMITIDDFFRANDLTPLFREESQLDEQKYIMAIVARQMDNQDEARRLHKELYEKGYENPAIYAGYSQILIADGDEAGGLEVLEAGRQKFSDNSEILFAEINYYIQKEDFATLETKLQQAIEREPENVGLYNALGNVYMNLSQEESNTPAQNAEYMAKSVAYYDEVIDRDPTNVDATYSIGSLYFNKAVKYANEMNNLTTSKADQARYDELNGEIKKLFEQALPYFEKAEKMDPDDRNTLIALKEIYARQNDFEKSKMYKERLEAMGG